MGWLVCTISIQSVLQFVEIIRQKQRNLKVTEIRVAESELKCGNKDAILGGNNLLGIWRNEHKKQVFFSLLGFDSAYDVLCSNNLCKSAFSLPVFVHYH